jgi:hypothetical protein
MFQKYATKVPNKIDVFGKFTAFLKNPKLAKIPIITFV